MRNIEQEKLIFDILNMPKYRHIGLFPETIRDVVNAEFALQKNSAAAGKSARRKIHNIVANYLGNPDYTFAREKLSTVANNNDPEQIKTTCKEIMQTHISTKERLDEIGTLYPTIFSITGEPSSILDLACGLNPFTFPWMNLPSSTKYHAFDIIEPRIDLINHFFTIMNMQPLAKIQDVLIDPPKVEADVAFILKEIHRFEQRRRGSTSLLYSRLNVKYLVVSLPSESIHSRHDFSQSHRALFFKTLPHRRWPVTEIKIGTEMFFILKKAEI